MVCLSEQDPGLGKWAVGICCFDVEDMEVGVNASLREWGRGEKKGEGRRGTARQIKGKKGKSAKEKEGVGARGRKE